jgi:citrate lyase subunit beta/citryl-CoA lyase
MTLPSTAGTNLPLTYLFVPGNRAERFDKALASTAGAVIVDLEDAVAPGDKPAARASFTVWYRTCATASERVLLRINDENTPWFRDDVNVIRETGVRGVVLPKVESAAQIARIGSLLPADGFVIALVETAKGIVNIDEVAHGPHLQRIAFGTLDYALDLDLTDDERGFMYPACRIALASRVANIASPIAGVTPEIGDDAKLLADLTLARAFGFGAKLCIHPKQVEAIHAAMRPTEAEIAWARRVVAAAETGQGAVQVDGRMVDSPVIGKARRTLARA